MKDDLRPRAAAARVREALARQAAVAIIGPRQVGKTTLARALADETGALYLDLERPDVRARLALPALYLEQYADRLVILDEIHLAPEIFRTLRGLIDDGRRAGRRTGRFLILGSASLDLLRQSESLAGRIAYVPMGPFDAREVPPDRATQERLWLRGGFPDSFLAASDADSLAWRQDFILSYLARDVAQFGFRIPSETLRRLWTMLAHNQGGPLNASQLAGSLAVSAPTVAAYVDALADLLMIRRLPPYFVNIGKRLVKSPKIYVRDSGLLHALLDLGDYHRLSGYAGMGASWEGFVIENLLAVLPSQAPAFFYRTQTGVEIDLLIERPDGRLWAIEIKRSLAPQVTRGLRQAMDDLKPVRTFIVYAGAERYPVAEDVEAIPLTEMMGVLLGQWEDM